MPKRLAALAMAVALGGLAIGIVSPAASDVRYEHKTLRLSDKASDDAQSSTDIDVGAKGFSEGDYFVFGNDPLFNKAGTKRVGWSSGDCVFVDINEQGTEATLECDVTFNLEAGSITVEGTAAFVDEGEEDLAVTGGTGAYEAAHGEVHVVASAEGLSFTVHLLL